MSDEEEAAVAAGGVADGAGDLRLHDVEDGPDEGPEGEVLAGF